MCVYTYELFSDHSTVDLINSTDSMKLDNFIGSKCECD